MQERKRKDNAETAEGAEARREEGKKDRAVKGMPQVSIESKLGASG
jgi:hypothetical protein